MIAGLVLAVVACWAPPVPGPVVVPYRAPECRWCAGHEALGFAPGVGVPVRAVADGRVVFAGRVAGVGYVTVRDTDGRRATYGGVGPIRVRQGQAIAAGEVLGRTAGPLTFSLREGERHVDPTPWFGAAVTRPRLVPDDGSRSRPAPVRLACPTRSAAR